MFKIILLFGFISIIYAVCDSTKTCRYALDSYYDLDRIGYIKCDIGQNFICEEKKINNCLQVASFRVLNCFRTGFKADTLSVVNNENIFN